MSMLHNDIGLISSMTTGLSTLGIISRQVELVYFNSFPPWKKFDTTLYASCLMIPQQTWNVVIKSTQILGFIWISFYNSAQPSQFHLPWPIELILDTDSQ